MSSALQSTAAPSASPATVTKLTPGRQAGKIKFGNADAFQKALKARVDRYFQFTKRSPRDCPQMYAKTAIILGWFLASYVLLVFVASAWWVAIPLAISLGLSLAAIGFNIQHD